MEGQWPRFTSLNVPLKKMIKVNYFTAFHETLRISEISINCTSILNSNFELLQLRKQPLGVFFKKGVLKNLPKYLGKHLHTSMDGFFCLLNHYPVSW